jgi:hypothetical protein
VCCDLESGQLLPGTYRGGEEKCPRYLFSPACNIHFGLPIVINGDFPGRHESCYQTAPSEAGTSGLLVIMVLLLGVQRGDGLIVIMVAAVKGREDFELTKKCILKPITPTFSDQWRTFLVGMNLTIRFDGTEQARIIGVNNINGAHRSYGEICSQSGF